MNKKYELTEETREISGHTLHRIRALKDFSDVKIGDLGGWIENEENLSHEGECWINDEVHVYGGVKIHDNILIKKCHVIKGNIHLYGNLVYDGDGYGSIITYST